METHYVCTGECNGVSDMPGTCRAKECSMHQEPLVRCECEDGSHEDAFD